MKGPGYDCAASKRVPVKTGKIGGSNPFGSTSINVHGSQVRRRIGARIKREFLRSGSESGYTFQTVKILASVLGVVLLLAPFETLAISSKQVRYYGGTVTQIPQAQTGVLITETADLRFQWKHGDYAIPYSSIVDMEYGYEPSVRIGTCVGAASLCSSCGKIGQRIAAKHHFLTLEFARGDTKQAVVLELGKALPQIVLPILAQKTGKEIVYQQTRAVAEAEHISDYKTIKQRIKPRMGFPHALELIKSIQSEAELNATFGPPNSIGKFTPDGGAGLTFSPPSWSDSEIFIPSTLIHDLLAGTKMIVNKFNTAFYDGASGDLIAYVDNRGRILGWSYSASLDKYHYLEDLPLQHSKH